MHGNSSFLLTALVLFVFVCVLLYKSPNSCLGVVPSIATASFVGEVVGERGGGGGGGGGGRSGAGVWVRWKR